MNDALIAPLRERVLAATHIVFFTGAGMSAESGIATFRDALTGLWERFDAATLASAEGYRADPSLVWGWYEWRRIKVMLAAPNAGHIAISDFIRSHPTKRAEIITQNVDDLHERAGCTHVTHLHGSLLAPRCFVCAQPAKAALNETIFNDAADGCRIQPPRCDRCTGTLRPGVVWFGESLPQVEFKHASAAAREAEVFIVIGTSGVVEPAARLVRIAKEAGAFIISINPNETMAARYADAVVRDTAVSVLPTLLKESTTVALADVHLSPICPVAPRVPSPNVSTLFVNGNA